MCSDFGRKKEEGKGGLHWDDRPSKNGSSFFRAYVDGSCSRIREQLYCLRGQGGIDPAADIGMTKRIQR